MWQRPNGAVPIKQTPMTLKKQQGSFCLSFILVLCCAFVSLIPTTAGSSGQLPSLWSPHECCSQKVHSGKTKQTRSASAWPLRSGLTWQISPAGSLLPASTSLLLSGSVIIVEVYFNHKPLISIRPNPPTPLRVLSTRHSFTLSITSSSVHHSPSSPQPLYTAPLAAHRSVFPPCHSLCH